VIALHHRRRPQLVAVAAALAACAAVAVALHPWASAGGPGGMRRYTAQGARASLLVGSDGEAVLTVRRLPPAPPGKVYEVWVISSGVTLPAGLMRGAVVALTRPVPRGAAVAVSVEPTGGSRRPTGPLLVRAETT
jgi:anti-sigma-K factor RskA